MKNKIKLFPPDKTRFIPALVLAAVIFAALAGAGEVTKTRQSNRLYTPSDPSAKGGIHGRVKGEQQLLCEAFAVPADNIKLVYRGVVSENGHEFSFAGLPVAKYDLLLVSRSRFYEGFKLTPDADSLTARDRKMIEAIIMKSVPFFNLKKIHRCEGTIGSSGVARCVLQEARTLPVTLQNAVVRTDIQVRSIKLACLEDIGTTGWQLVNTREIIRMEVGPDDVKGILPHTYLPAVSQIRVVDEIKELGEIELSSNP